MPLWNPWRGCHKCSEGCKFCYIHKGDAKRGVDTESIVKCSTVFNMPVEKYIRGENTGEYKLKSGELFYVCFSSDFLLEDADCWRNDCWKIIKERQDCNFIFLTKRIDRFMNCIPDDWNDGYDHVTVGCTVENQKNADYRLSVFNKLPIKHKNIICQPLIENINIEKYLDGIELVVVGGESDKNARSLDFDWVLNIRHQCINKNVHFNFRQTGTHFIKDGNMFNINPYMQMSQAKKAKIDF